MDMRASKSSSCAGRCTAGEVNIRGTPFYLSTARSDVCTGLRLSNTRSCPQPRWTMPPVFFPGCLALYIQVSAPEKGVMGAGAHSDWGLMTLLATVRERPYS